MILATVKRGAWTVLEAADAPGVPLAWIGSTTGTDAAARSLRLAVARAVETFARHDVAALDVNARRALVDGALSYRAPVPA